MRNETMYREQLSSNRTTALFAGLAVLFLAFSIWRRNAAAMDGLAVTFLVFFVLFFFYSVNYRTLLILIDQASLTLRFGIFTWTVPMDNIETCQIDEPPPLMKYGGAGIHFMMVRGRYRASFNFLEYSRLVIAFKHKVGPVRDISFSTKNPEQIMRLVRENMAAVS